MRQRAITYSNGITIPYSEDMPHFRKAKEFLIREGIYRTLNNYGPYTVSKASRYFTPVEVHHHDGLEIHIISTSVINFSLNTMGTSAARQTLEAWYMPSKCS